MGGRVPHVTLKGPSLVKEIAVATVMGFVAGFAWKQFHWNEQKKSRTFYDLLEKGEVTVVSEE